MFYDVITWIFVRMAWSHGGVLSRNPRFLFRKFRHAFLVQERIENIFGAKYL
jgi:hypothetical protein